MWYVYILKSFKDKKLYIGSTGDLKLRSDQQAKGLVFATKYRRPLRLIYYEAYSAEQSARQREKRLKYFGRAYQELKKRVPETQE